MKGSNGCKKRGKFLIRFTQIVNVVGLFQKSGYNNCIVVNANVTIDAICCWVHTRDIIPIKLQFVVFHDHMHALSGLGIMSKIQTIFLNKNRHQYRDINACNVVD